MNGIEIILLSAQIHLMLILGPITLTPFYDKSVAFRVLYLLFLQHCFCWFFEVCITDHQTCLYSLSLDSVRVGHDGLGKPLIPGLMKYLSSY